MKVHLLGEERVIETDDSRYRQSACSRAATRTGPANPFAYGGEIRSLESFVRAKFSEMCATCVRHPDVLREFAMMGDLFSEPIFFVIAWTT